MSVILSAATFHSFTSLIVRVQGRGGVPGDGCLIQLSLLLWFNFILGLNFISLYFEV